MTNLQQIFDEISELISDRGEEHGNFVDNMQGIANLWSNFLDTPLNSTQVCTMLCLVKISRITCGKFNLDDYRDLCGYSLLALALATQDDATKKTPE